MTIGETVKRKLLEPIPVHYHTGDREPHIAPLAMCELEGLHASAAAYIKSLEERLAKAVEDMAMLGRLGANVCSVCEHYNHGEGNRDACISCITQKEADCFRWRGMRDG